MNFKEIYDKTSNQYKSDFLYALLSDDSTLKNRFLNKVEVNINMDELTDYSQFSNDILSNYEKYKDMMKSLELEETNWEDYTPRHSGYIPEWEALYY